MVADDKEGAGRQKRQYFFVLLSQSTLSGGQMFDSRENKEQTRAKKQGGCGFWIYGGGLGYEYLPRTQKETERTRDGVGVTNRGIKQVLPNDKKRRTR